MLCTPRLGATALALLVLLTGCGGAATATSSRTPASPATVALTPLIALTIPGIGAGSATAELVSVSGTVVNQTPLAAVPAAFSPVPTTAGLLFLSGNRLELLGRSGSPTTLTTLTAEQQIEFSGAAASPDGRQIVYGLSVTNPNSTVTTSLYDVIGNAAPHPIATLTRAIQIGRVDAGGYSPLGWDAHGVLLGTDPVGIDGTGAFPQQTFSHSIVERLSLSSYHLSAPLAATGCRFGAEASDGTVVCIAGSSDGSQSLVVSRGSGPAVTVAPPANHGLGSISFLGSGDGFVFAAATSTSGARQQLYLVSAGATTATALGVTTGVGGTLDSSHIVCVEAGATAATTAVAVATTAGALTTVAPNATLLGVLG